MCPPKGRWQRGGGSDNVQIPKLVLAMYGRGVSWRGGSPDFPQLPNLRVTRVDVNLAGLPSCLCF